MLFLATGPCHPGAGQHLRHQTQRDGRDPGGLTVPRRCSPDALSLRRTAGLHAFSPYQDNWAASRPGASTVGLAAWTKGWGNNGIPVAPVPFALGGLLVRWMQRRQHLLHGVRLRAAATRAGRGRCARAASNKDGVVHAGAALEDFYGLLGLPRFDASLDEINAAYARVLELVHSGDFPGDSSNLQRSVSQAHAILSDELERSRYDGALRAQMALLGAQNVSAEHELDRMRDDLLRLEAVARCSKKDSVHVPGKQKVYVKTFGCQHNQSDGEYMMGQLRDYGYSLVDAVEDCDVCVVNSCTVKTPSESRGLHLVSSAREAGKEVVLAGCVPSGDKKLAKSLPGVSLLHVTQIDRIVDVVEQAAQGNIVTLLERKAGLPSLMLPRVRKSTLSEIITINAGCLGNCTYCKTKLARGTVVSYPIDAIIQRALQAVDEGVRHLELASEDMGAYGVDIGTNIAELLLALSDALPPGVMIRTRMTNPPYILEHLDGVVEALKRPNVYAFMHIPVQSGSNAVLQAMKREYTAEEFCYLVERLKAEVPDIFLLTDVICGFPTETAEDWSATMALMRKYEFQGIYSSRFFARKGTPAARLSQLKPHVTKERYRELVEFADSYDRNGYLLGRLEPVWFTETDEQRGQTIGRTKGFAKAIVPRDDRLLGHSAVVRVESTRPQHVEGQVVDFDPTSHACYPTDARARLAAA